MRGIWILFIVSLLFSKMVWAQQSAVAKPPSFGPGQGPVVAIDEAHKNTHTYWSREFQELVKLLQNAGYRVRPFTESVSSNSLKELDVLIVSNPGGWDRPDASLSDAEIRALIQWIRAGGSLLFVLDHRPFPLNAAKLVTGLGITQWHNGFAMVDLGDPLPVGNILFWRADSLPSAAPMIGPTGPGGGTGYQGTDAVLAKHPITEGRDRVRRVATFVGSAFKVSRGWQTLLTMPKQANSYTPPLTPNAIPSITRDTPHFAVGGWLQGAVKKIGKGRVAVFGETGLFSGGPAADNRQFVLNLISWLSGGF